MNHIEPLHRTMTNIIVAGGLLAGGVGAVDLAATTIKERQRTKPIVQNLRQTMNVWETCQFLGGPAGTICRDTAIGAHSPQENNRIVHAFWKERVRQTANPRAARRASADLALMTASFVAVASRRKRKR